MPHAEWTLTIEKPRSVLKVRSVATRPIHRGLEERSDHSSACFGDGRLSTCSHSPPPPSTRARLFEARSAFFWPRWGHAISATEIETTARGATSNAGGFFLELFLPPFSTDTSSEAPWANKILYLFVYCPPGFFFLPPPGRDVPPV